MLICHLLFVDDCILFTMANLDGLIATYQVRRLASPSPLLASPRVSARVKQRAFEVH